MALDPVSLTEHNGRVDRLGPRAETGAWGRQRQLAPSSYTMLAGTKCKDCDHEDEERERRGTHAVAARDGAGWIAKRLNAGDADMRFTNSNPVTLRT